MPNAEYGCPDCGAIIGEYHRARCPATNGTPKIVTSVSPGPFELLSDLRRAGFKVAVHNDYAHKGRNMTFWLFTHSTGIFVKGEGFTDLDALRDVISEIQRRNLTFGVIDNDYSAHRPTSGGEQKTERTLSTHNEA